VQNSFIRLLFQKINGLVRHTKKEEGTWVREGNFNYFEQRNKNAYYNRFKKNGGIDKKKMKYVWGNESDAQWLGSTTEKHRRRNTTGEGEARSTKRICDLGRGSKERQTASRPFRMGTTKILPQVVAGLQTRENKGNEKEKEGETYES